MTARFTALASGSAGNACLIEADGIRRTSRFRPRAADARPAGWPPAACRGRAVNVALLTHTHGDHWRETTLVHLRQARHPALLPRRARRTSWPNAATDSTHCTPPASSQPTRLERPIEPAPGLTALPLPVKHDAGATFGFRFEGGRGLFGPGWALGYAADLGCWDNDLARSLSDVDLLALEFNHDEHLQRTSGRPTHLIDRVLGDQGHLSNRQAQGPARHKCSPNRHTSSRDRSCRCT